MPRKRQSDRSEVKPHRPVTTLVNRFTRVELLTWPVSRSESPDVQSTVRKRSSRRADPPGGGNRKPGGVPCRDAPPGKGPSVTPLGSCPALSIAVLISYRSVPSQVLMLIKTAKPRKMPSESDALEASRGSCSIRPTRRAKPLPLLLLRRGCGVCAVAQSEAASPTR